jgi:hypothetical protein
MEEMEMKNCVKGLLVLIAVMLVASPAFAVNAISVNFYDPDPAGGTIGDNQAGVVRVGNWTDWNASVAAGGTTTMSALKDNLGNPTTAGGSITGGADAYAVASLMVDPGDYALMAGHWYIPGGTNTLALTAIPYAEYDLYVYYNANQAGTIDFTIQGTTTLTGLDVAVLADPVFAIADPVNSIDGNYVVFEGLSDSDLTLDATAGTNTYAYINGVQIVEVPEPMTIALLSLGGLALIRRKRA